MGGPGEKRKREAEEVGEGEKLKPGATPSTAGTSGGGDDDSASATESLPALTREENRHPPQPAATGTSAGQVGVGHDAAKVGAQRRGRRAGAARRTRGGARRGSRGRGKTPPPPVDPVRIQAEELELANEVINASVGGHRPRNFVSNLSLGSLPPHPDQAQAASQHGGQPRAITEPQPLGSCPHCHIGRGTVALHHLCRCPQCPDSPVHNQCPFCALAAVPEVKNWPAGRCPCCGTNQGIASTDNDHICRCYICRQVPDAVCPHCALAAVPQPRKRANGLCPCCWMNAGTVATHHLCLCVECQAIPGVNCPFCDLDAGQGGV